MANGPDPNRRQTRPKNANAHPGKVVLDATGRRSKEEIEEDKRGREERRQQRETKKASEKTAVLEIAEYENKMSIEDTEEEERFPRHHSKVTSLEPKTTRGKKRKQQSTDSEADSQNVNEGLETDRDESDFDRSKAKKQRKTGVDRQALRRTETYIEDTAQLAANASDDDDFYASETPKPLKMSKRKFTIESEDDDSPIEVEDDNFKTPRVLKTWKSKSRHTPSDDDVEMLGVEFTNDSVEVNSDDSANSKTDSEVNVPQTAKEEGGQRKGKDKQAFRNKVKQARAALANKGVRNDKSKVATHAPVRTTTQYDDNERVPNRGNPSSGQYRDQSDRHESRPSKSNHGRDDRLEDDYRAEIQYRDQDGHLVTKPKTAKSNRGREDRLEYDDRVERQYRDPGDHLESKPKPAKPNRGGEERLEYDDRVERQYRDQGDHLESKAKPAKPNHGGEDRLEYDDRVERQYRDHSDRVESKPKPGKSNRGRGGHLEDDNGIEIVESLPARDSRNAPQMDRVDAKSKLNSRVSATSGNNINIGQATAVGSGTKSKSNSKTKLTSGRSNENGIDDPCVPQAETAHAKSKLNARSSKSSNNVNIGQGTKSKQPAAARITDGHGGLSDEDDSVEKAAILESPPKGKQRLSSKAIVKVEKPTSESSSTDAKKSRSRETILGNRDIVSGWSKVIEPTFIYWFFYELSPWPLIKEIESCAQRLWDWRFGDKYPLTLADNPQHIQLLTQKLCDVRSHSAIAAIANLDSDFQASTSEDLKSLSLAEITELRKEYAEDLFNDTKFIFGKVIIEKGTIRKSKPYQSKLILRTFAPFFKSIKDVQHGSDVPLPTSKYPKTALAIATAAVERALKLCMNDDYDFVANKLIPKPDPNHTNKKLTTNMFAFSEPAWQPRMEFHLEKGIAKLKDKDWKNILDAAAQYSSFVKPKKPHITSRNLTQEEQDLLWDDSSSDSGPNN